MNPTLCLPLAALFLGVGNAEAAAMPEEPKVTSLPWVDGLAWRDRQVSVAREVLDGDRHRYRFSLSTAGANGLEPAVREREVEERPGQSAVRTGNALFDGLYALALAEAAQDSVAQIQDGSFNGGRPMPCDCFETGEKWHYVWTRDVSYSIDLGLAWLDPQRARNSLLFKQSGVRPGLLAQGVAPLQVIAQDTGSGGSWPISSDRVVWIHAASETLRHLPVAEARGFATQVLQVARDTLTQDHEQVFDPLLGLYRGETSFLDWREQSYPQWTRNDTLYLGESFALSTNVLHYIALRDAAELASGAHDERVARQFRAWADALRTAINLHFWQEDAGLYASYIGPGPNPVPARTYDLLGLALAINHGVADEHQAQRILQSYPVTAAGPPVIWPEQLDVPIYHNRALWPFVTAYALQAARRTRHAELATLEAESLLRGAALSLSNMENFEFLTQQGAFADGPLSGPVINSPRQLWSVAGYLNMVVETLFGITSDGTGVRIEPFLPGRLARELFTGQTEIALRGWSHAGATLGVTLQLPAQWSDTGWLEAEAAQSLDWHDFKPGSAHAVIIRLVAHDAPAQPVHVIAAADPHAPKPAEQHALFAPRQPRIAVTSRTGQTVQLLFSAIEPGTTLQLWRNGRLLERALDGPTYTDRTPSAHDTFCYSATQQYRGSGQTGDVADAGRSGLVSLPSREACAPASEFTRHYSAADGTLHSRDHQRATTLNGRLQFAEWGGPKQELQFSFTAAAGGLQRLRVEYANAQGPINTGITAAQKRVSVKCAGSSLQAGSIVMPHLPDWSAYGWSSSLLFTARQGQVCRVRLRDGFNMSYLEHFRLYTGGRGGASGPLNRANIAGVQVDLMTER
jgi:hypothetical protein